MNQAEFNKNMLGASALASLGGSPYTNTFWRGYQRGMRRLYHGEKFGTQDEHALWMAAADETRDEDRRYCGIGYFAGYSGMSISDAVKQLAVVDKELKG